MQAEEESFDGFLQEVGESIGEKLGKVQNTKISAALIFAVIEYPEIIRQEV